MEATGRIAAVNGNMIAVVFDGAVAQNEVGFAELGAEGEDTRRLMCEVVRIRGDQSVPYREIEPILLACARAGVWNVTFAVVEKQ